MVMRQKDVNNFKRSMKQKKKTERKGKSQK